MNTTQDIINPASVAKFLTNYAGFQYSQAYDYAETYPKDAYDLALKIKKSIDDDKSITKEFKNKMEL